MGVKLGLNIIEGHRLEEFQNRLLRETAGDGQSNRRMETTT
jgi:hypothetical protein